MASKMKTKNVSKEKIKKFEFDKPDFDILINVLENELESVFKHVSVQLVQCPDLTKEPFNLAASTLCGNMSIIDLGEPLRFEKFNKNILYNIEQVIGELGFDNTSSFIFGDSICVHPSKERLSELAMNVSFSPKNVKERKIVNKSRALYYYGNNCCQKVELSNTDVYCVNRGTFFLCQSKPGQVLKIFAEVDQDNDEGKPTEFIDAMRNAIEKGWDDPNKVVALAGVYKTKNVTWEHKLNPNGEFFENASSAYTYADSCTVTQNPTVYGIFNSSRSRKLITSSQLPIELQTRQTFRCLSHHSSAEYDYTKYISENDSIKYFGYFTPVYTLYRVDEPEDPFQNIPMM